MVDFIDDYGKRVVRNFVTPCEFRARVYWARIPGTLWTDAQAKARLAEAKQWYAKYCITLDFQEIVLPDPRRAPQAPYAKEVAGYLAQIAALAALGNQRREPTLKRVQRAFDALDVAVRNTVIPRKKKRGRGFVKTTPYRKALFVWFFDTWFATSGTGRTNQVSANMNARFTVGIWNIDINGINIVTHELNHALRRPGGPKVRGRERRQRTRCARLFERANVYKLGKLRRDWGDHYGGGAVAGQAMSRPRRPVANRPINNPSELLLTTVEYRDIISRGWVRFVGPCAAAAGGRRRSEIGELVPGLVEAGRERLATEEPVPRSEPSLPRLQPEGVGLVPELRPALVVEGDEERVSTIRPERELSAGGDPEPES